MGYVESRDLNFLYVCESVVMLRVYLFGLALVCAEKRMSVKNLCGVWVETSRRFEFGGIGKIFVASLVGIRELRFGNIFECMDTCFEWY